MKGKRPRQTKHADCFTSDTPLSSVSVPPVFPFDKTIVTMNSVSLTIISTSSIIVDDCETSIIRATSPIIFVPQITIPLPHTIIAATATLIVGSPRTISEPPIIISVTETVISVGPQIAANQRVPDGSHEIIISPTEIIIGGAETIISVLYIIISPTKAIISKGILVIDGPSTIIFGPDSIIYIHEAIISVLETITSATEIDFSKAEMIAPAFLTSFLVAGVIISALEKTASAVPAQSDQSLSDR